MGSVGKSKLDNTKLNVVYSFAGKYKFICNVRKYNFSF